MWDLVFLSNTLPLALCLWYVFMHHLQDTIVQWSFTIWIWQFTRSVYNIQLYNIRVENKKYIIEHPPLFSFSIYSNSSYLGAPPPLVFFLKSLMWAVFGSTVPLLCLSPFIQVARIWEHLPPYFSFFNYSKGYVWGHHSSLFFFLRLLRFPPIFLSSIIQVGRVWEHRSPLLSFSIYSIGPCLGAPSPSG